MQSYRGRHRRARDENGMQSPHAISAAIDGKNPGFARVRQHAAEPAVPRTAFKNPLLQIIKNTDISFTIMKCRSFCKNQRFCFADIKNPALRRRFSKNRAPGWVFYLALDRMIDTRCIFTGAGATNLKMREPL